jgi:hypothetical protein
MPRIVRYGGRILDASSFSRLANQGSQSPSLRSKLGVTTMIDEVVSAVGEHGAVADGDHQAAGDEDHR